MSQGTASRLGLSSLVYPEKQESLWSSSFLQGFCQFQGSCVNGACGANPCESSHFIISSFWFFFFFLVLLLLCLVWVSNNILILLFDLYIDHYRVRDLWSVLHFHMNAPLVWNNLLLPLALQVSAQMPFPPGSLP